MNVVFRPVVAGCLATVAAGGAATLAAATLLGQLRRADARAVEHGDWWASLDTTAPGDLLAGLAAAILLGCTGWLWTVTLRALWTVAAGDDPTRPARGVPHRVHRTALAACGLALTGGLLSSAAAVPTPLHEEPRHVPLRDVREPVRPPAPRHDAAWTVREGDTLWSIARASLTGRRGATAHARPDADIATRVRLLHRLNRTEVPDPDLIHPAQRLKLPIA